MTRETTSFEPDTDAPADDDTADPADDDSIDSPAGDPVGDLATEAATARVLRILSRSYLDPPTAEQLDGLATWADDWLARADPPDEIAGPLRAIRAARDADVEHLRQEFTRLFRGVSRTRSPKPPYESLYRDDQLYSSTTTEVRRGYLAAGLDVEDAAGNEPPDHLGIELQFLAALCEFAADPENAELPPDRARDAQEWFLDEHLLTWIVGLRGQVLQADAPAFYRAVLDLTVETLQAHRRTLHEQREVDDE